MNNTLIRIKNRDPRLQTSKSIGLAKFETILSEEKNHVVISYSLVSAKPTQKVIACGYITDGNNVEVQSSILLKQFLGICADYDIVYMHKASELAFPIMVDFFFKEKKKNEIQYKFECTMEKYTFYTLVVTDKYNNKKFEFRDSSNIMTMDAFSTVKDEHKIKDVNFKNFMDIDITKEVVDCNKQNCLVLKEDFLAFRKLIFTNFGVDITTTLTIPSLSLKIYITNFYKNEVLFLLDERADKYIRKSYAGGKTEVFNPHAAESLYHYKLNSIYGSVMKSFLYPVGRPQFFVAEEITEEIKTKKGFFKVVFSTPENLKHPFLFYKDLENKYPSDSSDSVLTSSVGEGTGVYFSEEINYAKKLGYTFRYISGYVYNDETYIFDDFVNNLDEMRLNNTKDPNLNKISNLLLNSLYEEFGMKQGNIKTEMTRKPSRQYDKIVKIREALISNILIGGANALTYFKKNTDPIYLYYKEGGCSFEYYLSIKGDKEKLNFSEIKNIAVASAITSYARIYIDRVMRKIEFKNIYHMNTDSIFLSIPMEDSMVSNDCLGKFKFEGRVEKDFFPSPNKYGHESEQNIFTSEDF